MASKQMTSVVDGIFDAATSGANLLIKCIDGWKNDPTPDHLIFATDEGLKHALHVMDSFFNQLSDDDIAQLRDALARSPIPCPDFEHPTPRPSAPSERSERSASSQCRTKDHSLAHRSSPHSAATVDSERSAPDLQTKSPFLRTNRNTADARSSSSVMQHVSETTTV